LGVADPEEDGEVGDGEAEGDGVEIRDVVARGSEFDLFAAELLAASEGQLALGEDAGGELGLGFIDQPEDDVAAGVGVHEVAEGAGEVLFIAVAGGGDEEGEGAGADDGVFGFVLAEFFPDAGQILEELLRADLFDEGRL
jgi:hypothetical protein